MRDEDLLEALGSAIGPKVAGERAVVFCSHSVDAPHWRSLLAAAGTADVLVLAFDGSLLASLPSPPGTRSAAQLLADRHALLATLATDSPLSALVDRFDPDKRAALFITDPLDPLVTGSRPRIGAKHPSWSLFEHKSVVDVLWDSIGLPRAESAVYDEPGSLWRPVPPHGAEVVSAAQSYGAEPSAGGGDIRWSSARMPSPRVEPAGRRRIRVMPMLPGVPCRLHGLVLVDSTVAFIPLELLVPRRPADGTFLCAGTAPILVAQQRGLIELTRWTGEALRGRLRYRGGFSVDGILTQNGFRPTDLNTRVTSAFEAAPPPLRVAVHASALLAREGLTGVDAAGPGLTENVHRALNDAADLNLLTVIRRPTPLARRHVRWSDRGLEACRPDEAHGSVEVINGPRGTALRAQLSRKHLPIGVSPQESVVVALRVADELLGTGIGDLLAPPVGSGAAPPTQRSGTT
ncbi:hypothetical protein ACPSM1_02535 [Micromonospora chersina]|uniref:hypothetical protein n=1 Tax=Micromonospora chersina TaxID=47854 RepID=UPI003CB72304